MACCNDNNTEVGLDNPKLYFDVLAVQKRITSLERRIADLENRLNEHMVGNNIRR